MVKDGSKYSMLGTSVENFVKFANQSRYKLKSSSQSAFAFLSFLCFTSKRVVKGGSRSRFTENKTVLSQFTKIAKITVIMKITVHGELNIYFSFHG